MTGTPERRAPLEQVLRDLDEEHPAFHGLQEAAPRSFNLHRDVLAWLAEVVTEDCRTLETGAGASTVVLAATGARHTAISPNPIEHERIAQWCEAHEVSLTTVEFLAGDSRRLLPERSFDRLDLVLVDGCHAFPSPILDWYYTAEPLRVGGLVVLDDVHIAGVGTLVDFLDSEAAAGRWRRARTLRRTVAFEKTAERVLEGIWWAQQPFCARTRRWDQLQALLRPVHRALFTHRSRHGGSDRER